VKGRGFLIPRPFASSYAEFRRRANGQTLKPLVRRFGFDPLVRFSRESDERSSSSRRVAALELKLLMRTVHAASIGQTCRDRTSNASRA
jgi:hypothetical protein